MHKTVGNILRIEIYINSPQNMAQARDIINSSLSSAIHDTRTNIDKTLGRTPGGIYFSRYIFLNIPLIADWQAIQE